MRVNNSFECINKNVYNFGYWYTQQSILMLDIIFHIRKYAANISNIKCSNFQNIECRKYVEFYFLEMCGIIVHCQTQFYLKYTNLTNTFSWTKFSVSEYFVQGHLLIKPEFESIRNCNVDFNNWKKYSAIILSIFLFLSIIPSKYYRKNRRLLCSLQQCTEHESMNEIGLDISTPNFNKNCIYTIFLFKIISLIMDE